ncbi:MAG: ankyrin repeat domain-containing protein, partial [Legionellaceae bacterium]
MHSEKSRDILVADVSVSRQAGHYHLDKPDEILEFCGDYAHMHGYAQPLTYVDAKKDAFKKTEKKLKIAPVAALKNDENHQVFGVFTTKDLWIKPGKKLVMGYYEGEVVRSGQENSGSNFVFELPDDYLIDAEKKCNWTARVNGAFSFCMANVQTILLENKPYPHKVEYYLNGGNEGLFLKKGTQLLLDYGSTEKYDHYDNKRALSAGDSWKETDELFQIYDSLELYEKIPCQLPHDFLKLFGLSEETHFAVPQSLPISDCYDLPYFAYSSLPGTSIFLSQHQQEHITPLMFACWLGDISRVTTILERGADPNFQSKISLLSAYHIVMLSPSTQEIKQQLIELLCIKREGVVPHASDDTAFEALIKNNLTLKTIDGQDVLCWWNEGYIMLQDQHEKSILHRAIENNDEGSVAYLIHKEPYLLDSLDQDNRDPLEYAIVHGKLSIIELLINAIDVVASDHYKKIKHYFLQDETKGRIRLVDAFSELCDRSKQESLPIELIFNALKKAYFNGISSRARKEMLRIKAEALGEVLILDKKVEERVMPSKKRKFSESTPQEMYEKAGVLYNRSIDASEEGDRLFDQEDSYFEVLACYQKALNCANQSWLIYMRLGYITDAKTTEEILIEPHTQEIKKLERLIETMKKEMVLKSAQPSLVVRVEQSADESKSSEAFNIVTPDPVISDAQSSATTYGMSPSFFQA